MGMTEDSPDTKDENRSHGFSTLSNDQDTYIFKRKSYMFVAKLKKEIKFAQKTKIAAEKFIGLKIGKTYRISDDKVVEVECIQDRAKEIEGSINADNEFSAEKKTKQKT